MNEIYIKKEDLRNSPATYSLFDKLFKNQDLISVEDIIVELENAYGEIDHLEEEIEDLENSDEGPINDPYDYYGVSRDDFI